MAYRYDCDVGVIGAGPAGYRAAAHGHIPRGDLTDNYPALPLAAWTAAAPVTAAVRAGCLTLGARLGLSLCTA